jgi:hypothetical protein
MAKGGLTLKRHYRPDQNSRFLLNITPETAQWKYISFKVARLGPNETIEADTVTEEVVVVPLAGRAKLLFNGETHELARMDLFRELADIAYLPPRTKYKLEAIEPFEVAIGGAPAEGKLPARIIRRDEIPSAVRGGANAKRGVSTLADSERADGKGWSSTKFTPRAATGQVSRPIATIREIIPPITRKPIIIVSSPKMVLPSNVFILGTPTSTWRFRCSTETWS